MHRHCIATVFSGQIRFCETSMACGNITVSTRVYLLEVPQWDFLQDMPLFLTEIVVSKRNFAIVLCLKCRRCSTEYLVAQTLRTITGSICLTIGTFPFLKEFARCRISDRPKGMLKLCHFICSALLTIFLTLSTALLLESGGVSALCHFVYHLYLYCTFSDTRCYILDPWTCWSLWEVLLVCE